MHRQHAHGYPDVAEEAALIEAIIREDERLVARARDSTPTPLDVDVGLGPDEAAFVVRKSVLVEPSGATPEVFGGDLVVTDRRLFVRGPGRSIEVPLDEIGGMAAIGARVLEIASTVGGGVALQVDRPRTLEAEIQAVRHMRAVRQP